MATKQTVKMKSPPMPGTKFRGRNGVIGTVLETKSPRGKLQASITCSVEGCKRTHVREQSDWWQCHRCRWHAKKRSGG
jgi:hypothetical protein